MKHVLSACLTLVALGSLPTRAAADGIISFSISADPPTGGTTSTSGNTRTDSFAAGSSKVGNTAQSGGDHYTLHVTYIGTSAPTSLTLTYSASMTGWGSYNIIGSPTPSGSVSGDYTGTVTKSGASQTISDSFNVAQDANPHQYGLPAKNKDLSNDVISVAANEWTSVSNGDGTSTFTLAKTVITYSASTDASAPVPNPRSPNYAYMTWEFQIVPSSLNVTTP